ncbi:MAG: hypothetical protein ACYS0E_18760, partial [Planctomycetota bacterium]
MRVLVVHDNGTAGIDADFAGEDHGFGGDNLSTEEGSGAGNQTVATDKENRSFMTAKFIIIVVSGNLRREVAVPVDGLV